MSAAAFTLGVLPTTLVLDGAAAELDVDNLGKSLLGIAEISAQSIVTSVHELGLRGIEIGRRFHVEQGKFEPMV